MRQRSIALEPHPFFPAAAINGRQPKADGRRYTMGGGDEAVAVTVQAALTDNRGP